MLYRFDTVALREAPYTPLEIYYPNHIHMRFCQPITTHLLRQIIDAITDYQDNPSLRQTHLATAQKEYDFITECYTIILTIFSICEKLNKSVRQLHINRPILTYMVKKLTVSSCWEVINSTDTFSKGNRVLQRLQVSNLDCVSNFGK